MNLRTGVLVCVVCAVVLPAVQGSAAGTQDHRRDTLRIDLPQCAVFADVSLRELGVTEAEIAGYGDDHPFFAAMDDMAYYFYTAATYCEKNAIPMLRVDTTVRIVDFGGGERFDLCDSTSFNPHWEVILHDRSRKPEAVSTVSFYEPADAYFGLTTTADE